MFWNDGWFEHVVKFCREFGIKNSEWWSQMLPAMETGSEAVRGFLESFVGETKGELFPTRESCIEFYSRPENFQKLQNALSRAIWFEFGDVAAELTEDDAIKAVILWGGPKVFCAGADIKAMNEMDFQEASAHAGVLQRSFEAMARVPKVVIAAINGYALGGGMELALTGDTLPAERFPELGLVNRLAEPGAQIGRDQPRQPLQAVDDGGAVAVQDAEVHRVQASASDGRHAGEALPLLGIGPSGPGAAGRGVVGEHDDLRRPRHRRLARRTDGLGERAVKIDYLDVVITRWPPGKRVYGHG